MGDKDQLNTVDRWGLFIVALSDPARAPMTLDIRVPQVPDAGGDGGERFMSMRIDGATLVVDREERYLHWDGTPERRPAAAMAFDLSSGARVVDLPGAVTGAPSVSFGWRAIRLDQTLPEFSAIADQIQCALVKDQTLFAGVAGPRLAIFRQESDTYRFVLPLPASAPTQIVPVYMPLEAAPIIPIDAPIARWEDLPPAFHDLMKTAAPMRRIPVRYFPGITLETAGAGFLVGVLAMFLAPMLFFFLFELVDVVLDQLKQGHGRWEGPMVLGLPVLLLGTGLWLAWRRWRRMRRLAARVRSGEVPCGLWLLESHLIYRDRVDACFVIARQHVRGIKTEFIGRTRQWLVTVDAPPRVFIRVSALDEFATDRIPETQGRAEALCQVLTQWWQDLGPMKRPAP